jgi:hypothetical protein
MTTTTFTIPCILCGEKTDVVVEKEAYEAWQAGALIQDVMGGLDIDHRELLISGICPSCFQVMETEAEENDALF